MERRNYAPGQFGQARIKLKEYGVQLREKQKVKRMYGVLERQFRRYFSKADRRKGVTGENLLELLELRLDNVVAKSGFAASHAQARQLIRHNHFQINGRKINIPSCQVKKGDEITVREKSRNLEAITTSLERTTGKMIPEWIDVDANAKKFVIQETPRREQLEINIQEQLIVELYSK